MMTEDRKRASRGTARGLGILLGLLITGGCLVVALLGGVYVVHNVPGVARLVYGGAPSSTVSPLPGSATLVSSATLPATQAGATGEVPDTSSTASPVPSPPALSRQEWIAFETKRGEYGDYEIFAMTPEGERLVNVTRHWADDVAPVWSPDGRQIAFSSLRDTVAGRWGLGPSSIYLIDFDPVSGTSEGRVTRVTGPDSNDGWAAWSPDGQRLAFHSDRSGNWDIWVSNLDGTGVINLTDHPAEDRYPDWSPDGERIAFTSKRGGNLDIWVMDADGSNPINLTNMRGRDRYPMWSPDGERIAFGTNRDGNLEIYVMAADGSNPVNVTNTPDATEGLADWSPDGSRLVLYSDRDGNKDIFVVDLASGEWTNITNDPASDEFCTWSP